MSLWLMVGAFERQSRSQEIRAVSVEAMQVPKRPACIQAQIFTDTHIQHGYTVNDLHCSS